jgi:hypothetical protein
VYYSDCLEVLVDIPSTTNEEQLVDFIKGMKKIDNPKNRE